MARKKFYMVRSNKAFCAGGSNHIPFAYRPMSTEREAVEAAQGEVAANGKAMCIYEVRLVALVEPPKPVVTPVEPDDEVMPWPLHSWRP